MGEQEGINLSHCMVEAVLFFVSYSLHRRIGRLEGGVRGRFDRWVDRFTGFRW